MNIMDGIYKAYAVLDQYDFTEDIAFCKDAGRTEVCDLYDKIIADYPEEVEEALDELGDLEIVDYFRDKYNVLWVEKIEYHMW